MHSAQNSASSAPFDAIAADVGLPEPVTGAWVVGLADPSFD